MYEMDDILKHDEVVLVCARRHCMRHRISDTRTW